MRNREAARYARWAARTAGGIALVVFGFYAQRAIHGYLLRRHGPAPVPLTVEQQSANFSYSDVEDGRTIFTVRASHATQFKDQDLAKLQDVWVTLYGRQGDRNDNIHTQECSYQPKAGTVECAGDVDIDLESANPSTTIGNDTNGALVAQTLHVKTSDLTFNRETGEASTPAPVTLTFEGGQGHGDGLRYDAHSSTLRVDHGVALEMAASVRTGGLPVSATAASLEFRRDDRAIGLGGPVSIRQGDRELAADHVSIGLDQQYRTQTAAAEGNPKIHANENGSDLSVTAAIFNAAFDAAGALQQIVADGAVNGRRKTNTGDDHFSAAHVEFAMLPSGNQLKEMTATGGVAADSQHGANARRLKTNALRIAFAPGAGGAGNQRIESAETLGPATIDAKGAEDSVNLKAAKFVAEFDRAGKLAKLFGHSGVQITRAPSSGAPQTSTASELAATFGPGGQWSTLDETGDVKLAEADRSATTAHARIVEATDQITLEGSPVISDATSQTSAGSVAINQKTGDIEARGKVVSTEFAPSSDAKTNAATASRLALGEGAAHITADALSGSTTSGEVTFQGHARLWQGQAVLSADRIKVSKDDGSLQAAGNVIGVFPQASRQALQIPAVPIPGKKLVPSPPGSAGVTLWQIRAPSLTYTNSQGKARLEGGVMANSDQATMKSQTLDLFLAPADAISSGPASSRTRLARSLDHVLAQGGVTITQGVIEAKSDQALYSAADGKFVLSGGEPSITDGSGNTTSGRSLTFYTASDTISVDSEQGSRTLTKHRVEK